MCGSKTSEFESYLSSKKQTMSLKTFLLTVAADLKRDEKFVDSVVLLLGQPGALDLACEVCDCASSIRCAGADITEVEHLAYVDLPQIRFDGAVSGGKMAFMVWLVCAMCCDPSGAFGVAGSGLQ